ncbi:MAG: putative bifunctional diguanylate cyclase/phosphodiesterase [Woeseiaceae bacterium]
MKERDSHQTATSTWSDIPILAAYGVAIWGAVVISYKIGIAQKEIVAVWPAAGIGVWVAIKYGWKSLPTIFIAHLAYSLTHRNGIEPFYLVTIAGNTLGCYLPSLFFRRWPDALEPLYTVKGVLRVMGILAVGMSLISATIGSITLWYVFSLTQPQLIGTFWRWAFSDFTGIMLVLPILIATQRDATESALTMWKAIAKEAWFPCLLSIALVIMLSITANTMPRGLGQYPIVLLTMPFCLWLTLRAGKRGIILLLCGITISVISLTLFAVGSATGNSFFAVQLYGVVVICTSLVLFASSQERSLALKQLAKERAQLETKVATRTSELEKLAQTDPLTGLANRRLFESHLDGIFERRDFETIDFFLFGIDLDQFKIVNDTSGHAAGDELLKVVANLLTSSVRSDDVIGRLGGDEFGVILKECSKAMAEDIAEEIRSQVEELRFVWETETYKIGASIGVAELSADLKSVDDAMQLADTACYAAKNGGRNRVHFAQADDGNVKAQRGQVRWAQKLNDAMEHDRFVLYEQEIRPVDRSPNQPDHIEVLVRLRDPEKRKLVPPGAFLPAAERYGLSMKLDQWVVRNLMKTLYLHQSFDATRRQYWVNLSGSSVGDDQFVDFLINSMKNSPIEPGLINFEITETAVIRNMSEAGRLMGRLHDMGCKFALDDFGTGVSSFSHLKHLPVDYLKIDGTFLKDIIDDRIDQIFVKSIIDIAHAMNIKSVAEYVENEAIEDMVSEMGVDFLQGYAISEPKLLTPDFSGLKMIHGKTA